MIKKIKDILSYSLFFLSDKLFCQITFLLSNRRLPNLNNPTLFNDKLLKLKLNSRDPVHNIIADKYRVRDYVKKRIGSNYLIPMIGIFNSVDEINFNELPNSFVLKITNGSQNNFVCTSKSELNWHNLKSKVRGWLKKNYYLRTREWQYKNIKSRIIIEEYLKDPSGDLLDYKFFCFNGQPKFVQIDSSRYTNHQRDFYDINFEKKLNYRITYLNSQKEFQKPPNYNQMLKIATKLSSNFSFIRVDLYNVNKRIFFGELTLYPGNCNERISPNKFEKILGNLLKI